MSFHAMAWAIAQKLPAMQKIVLIVIANRINSESGECYPSISRIAEDSGMTTRSVMQQIEKLELGGYIFVTRETIGKSKAVNRYKLSMGSEPNSLGVVNDIHEGSEPNSLGVVNDIHEGSEPNSHKPVIQPVNLISNYNHSENIVSSGNLDNLIYPSSLSIQEREAASKLLSRCNGEAQALLDTLSGAIKAGEIKKTPLSYLGGLVRRYESGEFDPSGAISIAIDRTKKAAREGILQKQYVVSNEQVLKELEGLRKPKLEPVLLADKIINDAEKSSTMINFRKSLKIK